MKELQLSSIIFIILYVCFKWKIFSIKEDILKNIYSNKQMYLNKEKELKGLKNRNRYGIKNLWVFIKNLWSL